VASQPPDPPKFLGRGRSAVVWAERHPDGSETARKVFRPDRASRIVCGILQGARNPYSWSWDAVSAAVERRRILERLVPLWFGPRLRLPATRGATWNEEARAFELRAERIRGKHVPLVGPAGIPDPDPLEDLRRAILPPLQARLEAAGFDGLVWQAGRGNPVAAGNFLLEDAGPGGFRWVWIDLESGVPALFALDPRAQIGFYLPKAARLRRPLFDDIDLPRLRAYLRRHGAGIERLHGAGVAADLARAADRLEVHQRRLLSLRRLDRSLRAAVASRRIGPEEARRYSTRPLRWYARLAVEGTTSALRRVASLAGRAIRGLLTLPLRRFARALGRFLTSQRYREILARRFVVGRLAAWRRRGFLAPTEGAALLRELREEETGAYVTDFVVHLTLKPFVKVLQWGVAPLLLLLGVTGGATTVVVILAGGAAVRTLYTAGRLVQAWARGRRRPWVALGVGALPVVGTLAYPMQLVAAGMGERDRLARFLLHDAFANLGRAIPVWGGADTLTEHLANRLPARFLPRRVAAASRSVTAAPPRPRLERAVR
jgi:hypothetical protein